MIALAGHGKDDRLIQVELPIVPNVGDRIREDCNNKTWAEQLKSLITEGEFVGVEEKYGKTFWKAKLSNGKFALMAPEDCQIIERAAAAVLVEKEINQSLLEQSFKVGDRVYQENPDSIGEITKISRGKALVNVGGYRTVIVPLGKLHHCDPNYLPKAKKSQEQIVAEEEAAIAKARDEYLKSQEVIEGDENYTPEYFLAPCKEFLGLIDLDPFSCAIANKTVQAMKFWTREDDALAQDWSGYFSKWVNPPYSAALIGKAIAKTLEYAHIGETLLLVNTSSSAKWFQSCMAHCAAYLHPSKRINFDSPYRSSKGNRYDQTLFYFGDRPLEFAKDMEHLGSCSIPVKKSVLVESSILVESSVVVEDSPKEDHIISISGEAILGISGNPVILPIATNPIQITEDRELFDLLTPICNWHSGKYLATFAGNALGQALDLARRGEIEKAIKLLSVEVLEEIKKPSPEVRKLKAFLENFTYIDADELPVFDDAIATEPSESGANLRMDEGLVSVLVEDKRKSKTKKVSSSGYAYPDKPSDSKQWFEGYAQKINDDRLEFLLQERDRLIASGACPDGVW
ncbi:MAG: DNA N-6-adenine-methyltransferase, partial [Pseudanabaena sp.]